MDITTLVHEICKGEKADPDDVLNLLRTYKYISEHYNITDHHNELYTPMLKNMNWQINEQKILSLDYYKKMLCVARDVSRIVYFDALYKKIIQVSKTRKTGIMETLAFLQANNNCEIIAPDVNLMESDAGRNILSQLIVKNTPNHYQESIVQETTNIYGMEMFQRKLSGLNPTQTKTIFTKALTNMSCLDYQDMIVYLASRTGLSAIEQLMVDCLHDAVIVHMHDQKIPIPTGFRLRTICCNQLLSTENLTAKCLEIYQHVKKIAAKERCLSHINEADITQIVYYYYTNDQLAAFKQKDICLSLFTPAGHLSAEERLLVHALSDAIMLVDPEPGYAYKTSFCQHLNCA